MKLSTETKEDLILCIDARISEIENSKQSDFIKESQLTDIVLMCQSLGLTDKANEIESDTRFEYGTTDPNEDRNNDTDFNNERESNFKNAFR